MSILGEGPERELGPSGEFGRRHGVAPGRAAVPVSARSKSRI